MDTRTWYVIRNRRSGKFVRAFLHQWQAERWCDSESRWTWATEKMHAKDSAGNVFDAFRK